MYRQCVCVAALCLAFTMAGSAGAQTILFEYWDNCGSGTAVSDLTSFAGYPDSPTSSAWLEAFQSPSARADNYGCRARAYLIPPETGDYTFWVAGDDYCQLWLSTDTDPANATMIAQVPGWTGVAEWGKYPEQMSAPVSLVAGQAYYIEGLMKEGGGGDSLDVGWAGPGIGEATTIIAGQYCTPFVRYQARAPQPADGAVDWTDPMFEWAPGDTAANHYVYLGKTPDLTEADLQTGTWPNMFYYLGTLEPGVTYYWRVDGIEEDGDIVAGNVWSFTVQPLTAHFPSPKDGALLQGSEPPTALSWTAGQNVVSHDVYFSTDQAAVAAGDPNVAVSLAQTETSFAIDANALLPLTTYYWRVDELDVAGVVQPGAVWSFRITDKTSDMNTDNWAFGVESAEPGFFATYVANGTYDIGTFGDEMTYEFVVRSNPDETMTSMCLIGRMNFGDTKAGLKYEQWNNTGTYGATVFGVTDFDYGVPTAPGEYTHMVFVASTTAGTTDLYVNGELKGSIAAPIILSGTVGIGRAIRENTTFVDNFDGDIFGMAIYDRLLTADEIAANADKYFNPIPVTDPDLLIYYTFEDGEGTTVTDQSGHSNHGLFAGSPTWAEGLFGGCVSINKATVDGIKAKSPLNIVTNTVTITGWAKHDVAPFGWSGILTHRGTSPGNVGLQHDGTELRYMWAADQYWSFSSGLNIPNGEWYFSALTISPTQGKLYLNGIDQTATNVAEHVPTNFDATIWVGRDTADGDNRIMTALIDEVRFYNRTLTDVDIQMLLLSNVITPGDTIQGVPNDGDWPGGEYPALGIDGDAGTKFLHFKGAAQPSGIQVTPSVGATIVTGLALTTANDDYGRDPVKYEVYGSNDSIDGPWTLIADGNVVDFSQATLWPRFTKNATAISFVNTVAYNHYQVLFTAIRDVTAANSMQVAEIELLGILAPLFVEDFEAYEVGSDLHGQAGWKGWQNTATAGAPASNAQAFTGTNSVEVIGSADLVHEFDVAGGVVTLSAMQYIPTGSTGTSYFIGLNQYNDAGEDLDWSIQLEFHLDTGSIINYYTGETTTIVYDKWVEVKCVMDLNNNAVDYYYDGALFSSGQWDDTGHATFQAIDLFGNSASSVWYDDIVVK